MTDIDVSKLREVAEAATPGPWGISHDGEGVLYGYEDAHGDDVFEVRAERQCNEHAAVDGRADAAYLAAVSPDVTLALLDRLERAEAAASPCSRCGGRPVINERPDDDIVICEQCAYHCGQADAATDFAAWVATDRAYNGSEHPRGQSLYNECINEVLREWAVEYAHGDGCTHTAAWAPDAHHADTATQEDR